LIDLVDTLEGNMNPNRNKLILVGAVLVLSALACNLPGFATPTPFAFPTPNLTLTAIFAPTDTPVGIAPTATLSSVVIASATPEPTTAIPATSTSVPPTNTPVPPTNTPVPTAVSYVGPAVRPGVSVSAPYLQREPTIDGVFDEWYLDRSSAASVVAGAGNWSGTADASSTFMVGWDDNNLYIAARVKDDHYVQNATGANLFKGDSVEVLIDTNVSGDFYYEGLNSDDYQLGISPGNPQPGTNPEAYLWYPQSVEGERQKVKVGATATDDGYRVEVKIPWNTFGVTPAKGRHFGFAFSVSDNDKSGSNVQQSMVSNVPTRVLSDPTTWGDLALVGAVAAPAPQSRSGTSVSATFLSAPPTLDGNLGDWSLGSASVNNVVFGKDKWSSAADLSGSVMVGWDANYLYLGAKVLDNEYVQNASGANLFLGDSLEILLDQNVSSDFYVRSLSPDDYQLGISPGSPSPGQSPQANLWFPKSQAGTKSSVKIGAISTADGYQVEAAVPWSIFGISPQNGQHYGFAFSISDNDNASKDIQQSMVSNVSTRVLTDPTTWGDLTLIKP
jgi:hypothetical protein